MKRLATPLQRNTRLALLLAGLLSLSACTDGLIKPEDPVAAAQTQAQQLLKKGQIDAAAQVWLKLAATSAPPEQQRYSLRAYRLYQDHGQAQQAQQLLAQLNTQGANPIDEAEIRLQRAFIAQANGDPQGILESLSHIPQGLPLAQSQPLYRLRAQAHLDQNQGLQASADLAELIALSPASLSTTEQQTLWETLQKYPAATLEQSAQINPSHALTAWAQLAAISKRHALEPEQLEQALANWQQQHPQHPANTSLLENIRQASYQPEQLPQRLGVLLPLSGKYAAAGRAVRDGIITAWYRHPANNRPELHFYDTEAETGPVINTYLKAYQDQMQAIIGPLLRSHVNELALSEGLPIPVLALNRADPDNTPDTLYQFGLDPTDEAQQIAEHNQNNGLHNALFLSDDNPRAERIGQAFQAGLKPLERDSGTNNPLAAENASGQLLTHVRIKNKQTQLSEPVRELLALDQSIARKNQIQRTIGIKLGFQPRRRQDADYIFLSTNKQRARLIKPLLRFHHAGDLPVFATSQIYDGQQHAVVDADMDGIQFVDIPWLIGNGTIAAERSRVEALWPQNAARRPRLYALGYDALKLVALMEKLRDAPQHQIDGATGKLSIDANNRVHRKLLWAQYSRGIARPQQQGSGLIIGQTPAKQIPVETQPPR